MSQDLWKPDARWVNQSCYIVGGGPSLSDFPWNVLTDKNVLGCNAAFYLGVRIVPTIVFGDNGFIDKHIDGLEDYAAAGGEIITLARHAGSLPSWLNVMKKNLTGLSIDGLAWNGNTGSAAINLALLFGANPIYLLGYDMQVSRDGRGNFHNAYGHKPMNEVYRRFKNGMKSLAADLARLFPRRQVFNLEDDTSALMAFPKQSLQKHFSLPEVTNGAH